MRPLTIADPANIILGLQEEIRRSEESRYDHRLHGVLLVAQGLTCPGVAGLLGHSRRTVEYWVRRFETQGPAGLREGGRPGRPRRLSQMQLNDVSAALRLPPGQFGLSANLWDGKLLSAYLLEQHGVQLGVRQCQRLFRQLGFRLRKPRPVIAHADPKRQRASKFEADSPPVPPQSLLPHTRRRDRRAGMAIHPVGKKKPGAPPPMRKYLRRYV